MTNWHGRDHVTRRLRLREYDYTTPSDYFVTICTEQRMCLFGEVAEGVMTLNPAGVVMESWWLSIPQRFPSVMIDEFTVMPNHLHGIITIGAEPELVGGDSPPSLKQVVQWFKGMTTKDYILGVKTQDWQRFPGRLWQQGFYDHIVRSEAALERLRSYIEANPSQWPQDEENLGSSAGLHVR